MLILNERSPDKSLYVKGASLLEKLKKHTGSIHVTELFNAYAEDLQISFPQFLLTLDWLYLIRRTGCKRTGGAASMFLKKFILQTDNGTVVREVHFKKGMNLILGEDPSGDATNNLGKTTLLRCIDFCLGGKDVKELYEDAEIKGHTNKAVEKFLHKQNPRFILTLSPRFEDAGEWRIERRLNLSAKRGKYTNLIDGETYKDEDFREEIKRRLFKFKGERPRLRELMGKFIRKRDEQISQLLKFNGIFSTIQDYEKVHLLLFGFTAPDLLPHKSELENKLKSIKNTLAVLERRHESDALQQEQYLLQSELTQLEEQRDRFQIDATYEQEAQRLYEQQSALEKLEEQIAERIVQVKQTNVCIEERQQDTVSIRSNTLNYLYEEAGYYSDELPRTFDDLVAFHNTMAQNEIEYLRKQLLVYSDDLQKLEAQYEEYKNAYNQTLGTLGHKGSLAEYTKLNDNIAKCSRRLGEVEALLQEIRAYQEKQAELDHRINQIQADMQTHKQALDDRIKVFNQFFSSYTEQLDGQRYILYCAEENGIYRFNIKGMDGNPGSGQKQAVIMAFDLAYMAFVNREHLERPLFATQDKIEVIDAEKLKTLFAVAEQQNGQFIAPVIADKLQGTDIADLPDITVLTLTPGERFFGI